MTINHTSSAGPLRSFFLVVAIIIITMMALGWGVAETASEASFESGEEVVPFLNQTVGWYRQLTTQQQLVSESSDILFLNDNRQVAAHVVRLSFDFARARAQALSSLGSSVSPNLAPSISVQYQRLTEMAAKADQQVKQSQQELDGMRQRLDSATGSRRRTLQATIAETESELELFQARRDAMRRMLQISTGSGSGLGAGTLHAQIEELARTVPAVAETGKEPGTAANSSSGSSSTVTLASQEHRAGPAGVLALISDLFSLRRKVGTLDDNLLLTHSLAQSSKALRTPLVTKIRELTQKGDQLAAQPDATDPAVLAQQKKDLDELTAQCKQLSATLLPLGKQSILLDVYKRSSVNWRNAVESQYETELKGLLLRLAGLAVILGGVLGVFELRRRATFRFRTGARRPSPLLPRPRI